MQEIKKGMLLEINSKMEPAQNDIFTIVGVEFDIEVSICFIYYKSDNDDKNIHEEILRGETIVFMDMINSDNPNINRIWTPLELK